MANEALVDQGRMLTAKQVATMLNVSKQVVWRLSNSKAEDRRIPSYKVGSRRRYKYDEVMWYLDKHNGKPSDYPSHRKKEEAQ